MENLHLVENDMITRSNEFLERYERQGAELDIGAPVWLEFDKSLCNGCGWCTDVCPESVFTLKMVNYFGRLRRKAEITIDSCINCGNCLDICKPKAIVDHSFNHIGEYLANKNGTGSVNSFLDNVDDYL
jgi:ferredoxin